MPNWCENQLQIRGPAEEIKRFKDSLPRVGNKYYPFISEVPLPDLKDESELYEYVENIEKESEKTLWCFHFRVTDLEVVEKSSDELELRFNTAYSQAKYLGEDLFPKLSILHKYFEPMNCFHGFVHCVKGKVIAVGHEEGEELDSPWEMYDYTPWPVGVNPLEEKLKNYIIIPWDQLRPMDELEEYLKKEGNNSTD
jgi:hypothetical protein